MGSRSPITVPSGITFNVRQLIGMRGRPDSGMRVRCRAPTLGGVTHWWRQGRVGANSGHERAPGPRSMKRRSKPE